ncbi:hypothetical protein ABPG72_003350 [Tetrahymena utriculariae]
MGKKRNQTKITEKINKTQVQNEQPKKQKAISKQKQCSQKQTFKQSKNKKSKQVKKVKVEKKSEQKSFKKALSNVSKKSQKENKTQAIVSRLSINEGNIPKQYTLIKQELLSCRELKSLKGQCRAEDVQKEIQQRVIKQDKKKKNNDLKLGMIDIVFCCNTIGVKHRQKYIKNSIYQMMQIFSKKYQNQPISVRFGFVAYRDYWDVTQTYVTCTYDLDQKSNIKKFVQSIKELNGGHGVLDGLYMASQYINWRENTKIPSLRYIFHLVNSTPDSKQNGFGSKKPCKCGLDVDQVAELINERQIHYRFIDSQFKQIVYQKRQIEEMKTILKSKLNDYEECKLQEASLMDLRFQDITLGLKLSQPEPDQL